MFGKTNKLFASSAGATTPVLVRDQPQVLGLWAGSNGGQGRTDEDEDVLISTHLAGAKTEIELRSSLIADLFGRGADAVTRRRVVAKAVSKWAAHWVPARPTFVVRPTLTLAKTLVPGALVVEKSGGGGDRSRGGKYHRRVRERDGRTRYYYSEDAYLKRSDAHADGGVVRKKHVAKLVMKKAAGGVVSRAAFDGLVAKYGLDAVDAGMRKSGLRVGIP